MVLVPAPSPVGSVVSTWPAHTRCGCWVSPPGSGSSTAPARDVHSPQHDQDAALVALGAHGDTAVGSRISAFSRGLTRRGWHVTVIDPPLPPTTVAQRLLGHFPAALCSMLHDAGVEGDVQPLTGWRVRQALRGLAADVVVVAAFSSLGIAAMAVDPRLPLVVDYRDPWSARRTPPTLARVTRTIERRAVRRASVAVYAGGPVFGDLLRPALRSRRTT